MPFGQLALIRKATTETSNASSCTIAGVSDGRLEGNSPGLGTGDQSGWPRRFRLGTSRLLPLAPFRIAQVWRWVVQSVGHALVLCARLAPFGRQGEAAWCGQEDTGGTRAAFGQA